MNKTITLYCLQFEKQWLEEISVMVRGMGAETRVVPLAVADIPELKIPPTHYSVMLLYFENGDPSFVGLLKRIHRKYPNIPLLVIGGQRAGVEIAGLIRAGAGSYLEKDHLPSLPDAIRQLLLEDTLEDLSPEDMLSHYDFLLNISGHQLSMIDSQYTYLAINEAFCKAHNLIRDEVIGKTPETIWGKESFKKVIKPNLKKSFSKEQVHYRAWFELKTGEKRLFEVTFYPHTDISGEVDYVVVETKDITSEEQDRISLKTINEDLNLLNQLNELLLEEASHDAIGDYLCREMINLFEGFTSNLYYYLPEEEKLKPIRFSQSKDITEKIEENIGTEISNVRLKMVDTSFLLDILHEGVIREFRKTAEVKRIMKEMVPGKNSIRNQIDQVLALFPIKEVIIIPLVSGDEKLGLLSLSRFSPFEPYEIERISRMALQISNFMLIQRREESKRNQAQKLELLFELATDGIFFMEDNRFIDCNPRTLEMFRVKREEIIGHTPIEFSPEFQPGGEPSDQAAERHIRLAYDGKPQSFEWVHIRKDGTPFHALISLNKVEHNNRHYLQALVRNIDDLKKAFNELEEKEKALREAQEIAGMGSWDLNIDTGKHLWSPQVYAILEYDPKKVKPSRNNLTRRIFPEDRKKVNDAIENSIRNDLPIEIDYRLKMPDGRLKYIHAVGLVDTSDKNNRRFKGTIHDVSEIRKAEIEISQRSAQLDIINKVNSDLNQGKSLHRIVQNMNKNLSAYFPISNLAIFVADLIPGRYSLLVHSLSSATLSKAEKMLGAPLVHFTLPALKNNAVIKYFHKPGEQIINDQRRILRLLKDFLELIDSKASPEALNKTLNLQSLMLYPVMLGNDLEFVMVLSGKERIPKTTAGKLTSLLDQLSVAIRKKLDEVEMQRLYAAVEQMDEIMLISDVEHNVLYINPAGKKVTGNAVGKNGMKASQLFKHPEVNPATFTKIWNNVKAGETWKGEVKLWTVEKKTLFVHAVVTPIKDEFGKVQFFVSLLRDMTREIEMRHFMQRSQSLEMIGRFAGGLAHDFNNILATMLGYSDMVMDEIQDNQEALNYLSRLKKSGIKAREIIQQLLTFNRNMEPSKTMFLPKDVVQEALELVQPQLQNKITIDIHALNNNEMLLADPVQFKQVVLNLISNALQALSDTPKGRITVKGGHIKTPKDEVEDELGDLSGKLYRFQVRDNGVGMNKKTIDHIFDPFFTTQPVGKGSGMGLSVVYGIVSAHNGKIFVKSKTGKGTTFTLYFPVN